MFTDVRHRQIEENECGLACLARAAASAGSNLDLPWLRERWPAPAAGLTLLELERVATEMGFTTAALRCGLNDLPRLQLPCVVLWKGSHYVLLERVRPRRVDVFDPARGPRNLRREEFAEGFSGVALTLTATGAIPRREQVRFWPARLGQIDLRAQAGLLIGLSVSLVLLLLAYIAWPIVLTRALAGEWRAVVPTCLLLGLAHGAALVWRRVLLLQARRAVTTGVGGRLLTALTGAPVAWLARRPSMDLISRLDFAELLGVSLSEGAAGAAADAGLAVLAVLCLAGLGVWCAMAALAGFLVRLSVQVAALGPAARHVGQIRTAAARERQVLRETFSAPGTMRANGLEASRVSASRSAATVRLSKIMAYARLRLGFQIVDVALAVGALALCGVLARDAPDWPRSMAVFLAAAHLQFRAPGLFSALREWDDLVLRAWRAADQPPASTATPAGLQPAHGPLQLAGVTHRLSAADPVLLDRTDLTIPAGAFVAITGPVDSDLSALAQLLGGLAPPCEGKVLFGGQGLCDLPPLARRRTVGLLLEEDALFTGSIAENLAGFGEADPARVRRALEGVGLAEMVRSLPDGLETVIDSPHIAAPHRRALQIARTLFEQPPLLVLDRPSSALLPASRRALFATLQSSRATRVVLTRDRELIALADRVLAFEGRRLWVVAPDEARRAAAPAHGS